MGQFGGLDIKTSHEPKLRKNWKIGHFSKIQKRGHYSGIIAWYWNLMVLIRIQSNKPPPLYPEVEGVFVGEEEVVEEKVHSAETMTNKGKGCTDPKKVEYINSYNLSFFTYIRT